MTLSSLSQSPCLSETLQNGQKAAPVSPKSSTVVKKQEPMTDSNKQIRPAGTRRCVRDGNIDMLLIFLNPHSLKS